MSTNNYKKGGLLLSENTLLLFDRMTDEEALSFIRIIRNYHRDGTLPPPQTERLVSISFDVFKLDYDESQKKYQAKVDSIQAVNEGRKKTKSSRKRTTTHEDARSRNEDDTTTHEDAPNTLHNNTEQNNNKEKEQKKDVSLSEEEEEFNKWMVKNYPHLSDMEKPLTLKQYDDLQSKGFGMEEINAKLSAMENDKDVPRKKRSCYEVLLKWLKNG